MQVTEEDVTLRLKQELQFLSCCKDMDKDLGKTNKEI
jgi:hypothetical protein